MVLRVSSAFSARLIVVFIVLLFLGSMVLPVVGTVGENQAGQGNGRSVRASLLVDGNKDQTMSNQDYDSVWVKDNATLTIPKIVKSQIDGRFKITDNASVIIEGDIEVESFTAHCKRVVIDSGKIVCKNAASALYDGRDSLVIIHTQEPIEIKNGGEIKCTGKEGVGASSSISGGKGGHGLIELITESTISIIGDSMIQAIGGRGGGGSAKTGDVNKGGDGGNGLLTIQANGTNTSTGESMVILESTIEAYGGAGGDMSTVASAESDGTSGDGGSGEIHIFSKGNGNVNIEKSSINSVGGSPGGISSFGTKGEEGDAPIFFDCTKSLIIDFYKKDDASSWSDPKGTKISSSVDFIEITAKGDATLFTPQFREDDGVAGNTKAGSGTNIYIYNILPVLVIDNSTAGNPLEGVVVTVGTQNLNTNSIGMVRFLEIGFHITKGLNGDRAAKNYKVTAKQGDAEGSLNNVEIRYWGESKNTVTIRITLITVMIEEVSFKVGTLGGTYERVVFNEPGEEIVYGDVTVKGVTFSSFDIKSVDIQIIRTITVVIEGEASTNDGFNTWSYTWDSSVFPEGVVVTIKATGYTKLPYNYDSIDSVDVTISDTPKPPEVNITSHSLDIDPHYFQDTETKTGFTIRGKTFDPNWISGLLTSGKNVVEVTIRIRNKAGTVDEVIPRTIDNGLIYYSPRHEYNWSYFWNTHKTALGSSGKFQYPNGEYTIEIYAKDDTSPTLVSSKVTMNVSLKHILKPTAVIKSIDAIKNGNAQSPPYKREDEFKISIYKFESDKGKSDVTIRFDLSASYDPDDSKNLEYFINYGDGWSYDWETNPIANRTYTFASNKKITKSYQISIKVRDPDKTQNDLLLDHEGNEVSNLTVEIEFIPEDPPMIGPLAFIVALPLHLFEVTLLFIILLIVFNIVAAMIVMQKYKKISKRRRAREAALDASKIKADQEEAKSKGDIYSHLQIEQAEGSGTVSVAGSAAATDLPTDEMLDAEAQSAMDYTMVEEPEAPKLISAGKPVFEFDVSPPEVSTAASEPAPVQPQPAVAQPTATTATTAQPVQAQAQVQPAAAQPVQAQAQVQPQPAVAQPAQAAQPAQPTQPTQPKQPETEEQTQ